METIETNVAGTELVLRLAAERSRRIVLASTSEVYGKSAQLPFREDGDLVLGATSASPLELCLLQGDRRVPRPGTGIARCRLPVTIARLFNTVGPRQTGRYGMVLPTFVRQALRGEPITVYGSGEQSRCFTHVFDIVEGLAAMARHDCHHRRNLQPRQHLGDHHQPAGADWCWRPPAPAAPSSTSLTSRPTRPGFEDMQRRLPNIAKAQAAFNFQPRRNLRTILADIISDMRNRVECCPSAVAPNP